MPDDLFTFDNTYARLPPHFYARLAPTPVAAPRLLKLNETLARALGLDPDALRTPEAVASLAGSTVPAGATPLAMAYAGHQFGHFAPQLGDGRAILLGEFVGRDGLRRDLHLKGSGRTPFSRMGDGRAAVGPCLREYIVSEAMAALGIPTTRALAVVATGERIQRETPKPGAVLVRIAESHVRVGTFQYFRARDDVEGLRQLADYVIARHMPALAAQESPYRGLLGEVIARTADLVARWMLVGFIHGVMNTDNVSVVGETIDYGPCAFMDQFHPGRVYSSIDADGRYAYGNQPNIAQWNLVRLAEALLPLLDADTERGIAIARAELDRYADIFNAAYLAGLRRKLGLTRAEDGDAALAQGLLDTMTAQAADFTATFRALANAADGASEGREAVRAVFADPAAIEPWLDAWETRLAAEGGFSPERRAAMRAENPLYIPRNHLVEEALQAAEADDLTHLDALLEVLARPYEEQQGATRYALPPRPEEVVTATFCGT